MRLLSRFEDDEPFRKRFGKIALYVIGAIAVLVFVWNFIAQASAADKGGEGPGILGIENVAKKTGWTGVYIGVGGGYQVADIDVSALPGDWAGIDGLSGRGWAGDARLGFDWHFTGSPFVVGLLGGYNLGEAEFTAHLGPYGANATIEPTWYVGGRAGLAFGKSLVYAGYAWQEADAKGSLTFEGATFASGSTTVNGHVLLVGLETVLAPQLTLGAEYSLAKYETITINDAVDVDPDVHAFKIRLNWRPFSK